MKQEEFFEFCLRRLETIFYAIFPLCGAGCSNRPWHLLQCKLPDDRDVLVADFIELYLERNQRFKSNWQKGLLTVEVWIYYWWIFCKYICSLRMVLRTVADLHFLKRHSGKYCVAEHTLIRSALQQTFLLLQWIFIKCCRTCIFQCSSQSLHFKISWIFCWPVLLLLACVAC